MRITEPDIINNLRIGQYTYLLSGGVLMWDVLYLWVTYIVSTMWNILPYSFRDLRLELVYLLVAVVVTVTLLLGPVLVVLLVAKAGWRLAEKTRQVERSCWERLELERRTGERNKES